LAHQEALITERETEIRNIETGILELNEIFGQLGTIVQEQGNMVGMYLLSSLIITIRSERGTDNIESNIRNVEDYTQDASRELTTASDYQRKAGRRAACLSIILIVVVGVVLIAVRILIKIAPWLVPWLLPW
jgi:t-SNARE complex subunit (syntaxin)